MALTIMAMAMVQANADIYVLRCTSACIAADDTVQPAGTYLSKVLWDGVTPWTPPAGFDAVKYTGQRLYQPAQRAQTGITLSLWNALPNGWGASATAICALMPYGPRIGCPVSGGFAQPWGPAAYTARDTETALFQNDPSPPFFTQGSSNIIAGTFTATSFQLTTPLTTGQVAMLRVGMVIDTNDSPVPYSGLISNWAADGSSITVQAWYQQNNGGSGPWVAATPSGTGAKISPKTKTFAANFNYFLRPGAEEASAVTQENDCYNNSGSFSTVLNADLGCVDAVNLGADVVAFAYRSRGKFVDQIRLYGSSQNAAISVIPGANGVNVAFSLLSSTGETFRNWTPAKIFSRLRANSVFDLGAQGIGAPTTANTPTINLFSSGGLSPDSTITGSGGAGSPGSGMVAINSTRLSVSGDVSAASYSVGVTQGVSCAAGTVSLATLVVTNGIVTHC